MYGKTVKTAIIGSAVSALIYSGVMCIRQQAQTGFYEVKVVEGHLVLNAAPLGKAYPLYEIDGELYLGDKQHQLQGLDALSSYSAAHAKEKNILPDTSPGSVSGPSGKTYLHSTNFDGNAKKSPASKVQNQGVEGIVGQALANKADAKQHTASLGECDASDWQCQQEVGHSQYACQRQGVIRIMLDTGHGICDKVAEGYARIRGN